MIVMKMAMSGSKIGSKIKVYVVLRHQSQHYVIYVGCNSHPENQEWELYDHDADQWYERFKCYILGTTMGETLMEFTYNLSCKFDSCRDSSEFQDETKYFLVECNGEVDDRFAIVQSHYNAGELHHSRAFLPLTTMSVTELVPGQAIGL